MKKLLVYDPGKRKLVQCGYIDEKIFIKPVISRKHFMKVVGGYGIQETAFDELIKREVEDILLKEEDTKVDWISKTEDWERMGRVADYGNGRQRFLATKYMSVVDKSE